MVTLFLHRLFLEYAESLVVFLRFQNCAPQRVLEILLIFSRSMSLELTLKHMVLNRLLVVRLESDDAVLFFDVTILTIVEGLLQDGFEVLY